MKQLYWLYFAIFLSLLPDFTDKLLAQVPVLSKFSLKDDAILSVKFMEGGKKIAIAGEDNNVTIIEAVSSKKLDEFPTHQLAMTHLDFDHRMPFLITSSTDRTVRFWHNKSMKELGILSGHNAAVSSFSVSPTQLQIATASLDSNVYIWDMMNQKIKLKFDKHKDWVSSVVYSKNGNFIASSGFDKTIRIWDSQSGDEKIALTGHQHPIQALAFSNDGKLLVSGDDKGIIILWDAEAGRKITFLLGHSGIIRSLKFSPDQSLLASCGDDKSVRLWDVFKVQEIIDLKQHEDNVNSIDFSPDGNWLASGSQDKSLIVYDIGKYFFHDFFDLQEREELSYSAISYYSTDLKIEISYAMKNMNIEKWDEKSRKDFEKQRKALIEKFKAKYLENDAANMSKIYNRAHQYFLAKHYFAAIAETEKMIKFYPNNALIEKFSLFNAYLVFTQQTKSNFKENLEAFNAKYPDSPFKECAQSLLAGDANSASACACLEP